ncbi:hypothetical protein, partial [Mesorhizobium sp. M4A.F.Ca.ET.050.02.1.1]|uniref:hypothetical protein n=1 Tax=Mesorhizobium sp. M4A.F.Ca.ET.050.02.1.1 TaxID=2496754 RepID=UPI00167D15C2
QRAEEGGLKLPPAGASDLAGLPLDELLKALVNASRPKRRTNGKNADFTLRSNEIGRIEAKLANTEQQLVALEARRADVDVLDDKALNHYQRQLTDAQQTVLTLRAARDAKVAAHERETAAEARQAFGETTCATIANSAAAYTSTLEELAIAVAKIATLKADLDEHKQTLEGAALNAIQRGRPDLAHDVPELIRRAVNREIAPKALASSVKLPERYGETDEQWHARLFQTLQQHAEGRIRGDDRDQRNLRHDRPRIERAKALDVERRDDEDDAAYGLRLFAHLAENLPCRQAEGETDAEHNARLFETLAKT